MRRPLGLLLPLAMAILAVGAEEKTDLARPEFWIRVETMVTDRTGIHPLGDPGTDLYPVQYDREEVFYTTIKLRAKNSTLEVALHYGPKPENRLFLRLERTLKRGAKSETLPVVEHGMDVVDAWTTTLLEDSDLGGRLDLRVIPMMRPHTSPEPFSEGKVRMKFEGPLILLGKVEAEDRVMIRELTATGIRGLDLGLPGVGIVKLNLSPFPGAAPCGWVRGHVLSFRFGDKEFMAWSVYPLLPDDLERPDGRWTIYGTLAPDPTLKWADSYYGMFELTR